MNLSPTEISGVELVEEAVVETVKTDRSVSNTESEASMHNARFKQCRIMGVSFALFLV
jgi:hypothetical protein